MEILLLAVPVIIVLWIRRDRRALAPEAGATVPRASGFRPDTQLEGAPVSWRSLRPLVRVEARRLARHPAPYLVFLPVALVIGISAGYGSVAVASVTDVEAAILLTPFAWGAMLAADLNVLRSRRWGTDELLATMPVPTGSRTIAHAAASIGLVPPALLLLAGWLAVTMATGRVIGTPRPVVLLVGPLLVVGGSCLGVAVARWLPRPGLAWIAVIATIILQTNLGQLDLRWRWLHFSMYASEMLGHPDLSPERHGWHAVYLLGGALLVSALAVLRSRRDVRVLGALAMATVLIGASGWLQVQPASESDRLAFAGRFEHPEQYQRCSSRDQITFCAADPYLDLVDAWNAPVQAVWRRLPADARPRALTVRQRRLISALPEVPNDVLASVDPTVAFPNDGEVSVSTTWAFPAPSDAHQAGAYELSLAFRVAAVAVGLPPDAFWSPEARGVIGSDEWATALLQRGAEAESGREDASAYRPAVSGPVVVCSAGGQARSVAALWLAGQSTPAARRRLRDIAGILAAIGDLDRTVVLDTEDSYRTGLSGTIAENGTAVRVRDLVIAARLLDQPDDVVAGTIAAHWSELRRAELSWTGAASWFAPLGEVALPLPPHDPDDPEALESSGPARPRFLDGACQDARPDDVSRP